MNILIICGKYSTLSIPFIKQFKNIYPDDKLIIFIVEALKSKGIKPVISIFKNNRIPYLFKKGLQALEMLARSKIIERFISVEPKYIHEHIKSENIEYYQILDINSKAAVDLIKKLT